MHEVFAEADRLVRLAERLFAEGTPRDPAGLNRFAFLVGEVLVAARQEASSKQGIERETLSALSSRLEPLRDLARQRAWIAMELLKLEARGARRRAAAPGGRS